jgi:hypothetical protein
VTATLTAATVEVDANPLAFYELSLAEGWGDGAPLVPPTDDVVLALLGRSPYPADHVLCVLPPRHGVATVELVAINAAMAGCAPDAFPVVVAALEAISVPAFDAFALTTTTSSVFPMLVVNGPCRDDLGIDYRAGCMGGAAGRGSMTIGRAVSLCLRNIGGQRAGETSRTVFGQPARFGLCFGEWEERSPWPSLARRRGFSAGEDVVTVHGGKGTMPMADINNDDPRDLVYLMGKSLSYPLANLMIGGTGYNGQLVVAINPIWADRFGEIFADVEGFQSFLWEHTWQPIELWPDQSRAILEQKDRVEEGGKVRPLRHPGQLVPVVCGGLGGLHAIALPSFGESDMQSVAVARAG